MAINELTDLLKQTMGLDPASVGAAAIERAAEVRRIACHLPDQDAYLRLVAHSAAELLELIEAVVVPETWFFRHAESFVALQQLVWREWVPANPESSLRLLSIPCSTGEEPYSIAMALISSGLPPTRFRVDAVDISGHALIQAERGLYGRNSFRGADQAFRSRFFTETPQGSRISEELAGAVSFQAGNILAAEFLPGQARYEVIFCRNLLIYFDSATQARAIKALERLLTPKGCLFVGPAEAGLLLNHGFASARLPMSFAFRKVVPASPVLNAVRLPKPVRPASQRRGGLAERTPLPQSKSRPATKARPVQIDSSNAQSDLDHAARLADAGKLAEAAALCEAYLKEHQESARGFYILGVVSDASGDPEKAGGCYRRALYLDPDYHDAMMQLAYAAEQSGGVAAGRNLRDRARRVREKAEHG